MNAYTEKDYLRIFGELGFDCWETGGGCTAFGINLDDQDDGEYILVTDAEDSIHPQDDTTEFSVGHYNDESECLSEFVGDLKGALDFIHGIDAMKIALSEEV